MSALLFQQKLVYQFAQQSREFRKKEEFRGRRWDQEGAGEGAVSHGDLGEGCQDHESHAVRAAQGDEDTMHIPRNW